MSRRRIAFIPATILSDANGLLHTIDAAGWRSQTPAIPELDSRKCVGCHRDVSRLFRRLTDVFLLAKSGSDETNIGVLECRYRYPRILKNRGRVAQPTIRFIVSPRCVSPSWPTTADYIYAHRCLFTRIPICHDPRLSILSTIKIRETFAMFSRICVTCNCKLRVICVVFICVV